MAKSNKFFLATVIGAVAGTIGGLLFAPQSGEKTRGDIKKLVMKLNKDVSGTIKDTKVKAKEVFGKATDEAVEKYKEVKLKVINQVAKVKTTGKKIDKEKYSKIVKEVVAEFKSDFTGTKNGATKMVEQLKKDWEKVKKSLT